MNKFITLVLIFYYGIASSQSLQRQYDQSQASNNARAIANEKAAQEEVEITYAASKSGVKFKCGNSETLIFYRNRVFFESPQSALSGTIINGDTWSYDKVYFKTNGEWLIWSEPMASKELNTNTGRLLTQLKSAKQYIADGGNGYCKRIQ